MLDDLRAHLSEDLRAIFDLEIGRGNPVAEELIDAWELCPYQIVFQNPLDLQAALELNLAPTVKQYIETDPHYPAHAGFISESSRHSLSGPHPHGSEVPTTFCSGPAELILLAPADDLSAQPVPRGKGRLADLAAELAQDPRPFEQLSPEDKRTRLARIRGSARGLLTPSAEFARREADEIEIEERKLGKSES